MIYRIYGQKDSTIYENSTRKAQNTGLDEILEVSKIFSEDGNTFIGNSRILTKFDLLEISQSIQSGEISNSPKYKLNLTSTQASEVLSEYTLEVYPVSQSWNEGNGQYMDNPLNTNGNSWERRSVNSHVANIGDVRSLAIHPASTTHSQLTPQEQVTAGVTPGLVRLSVGIENFKDIQADLELAFAAAK